MNSPSFKEHYTDFTRYRAVLIEIEALFGIAYEDARTIERQWRLYPEQRRAKDLVRHTALTLRARRRFLSGGKKVAA